MAEAKSPRKKTSASKPAKAAPAKAAPAKAAKPARAAPAKAAPARAAKPTRAAPAKAAPARAAKPTRAAPAKATPAKAAKPDPAKLSRAEIEQRKEKKKNAALRVAKKNSGPRTAPAKAAPAKAAPAKAAPAKKKPEAKKDAAPKPKPRKRPELSATTPDAAALRRDGARELAKLIAAAGLDKKAERIEILDIGEKVDYADFLVLMSGRSDRQVRSVADGVTEALKEKGHRPGSIEGMQQGQWVLVDYSDVIVHVFVDEARRYYDLEGLWMDATRVPFEGGGRADGADAPRA
jgi:ribosome-associated protein